MTKLSEYVHNAKAAEYLCVHHNTLGKWAGRGAIPMHLNPVNGYRLFKRSDMDKFLMKAAIPVNTLSEHTAIAEVLAKIVGELAMLEQRR
jgi:hypothetical protein